MEVVGTVKRDEVCPLGWTSNEKWSLLHKVHMHAARAAEVDRRTKQNLVRPNTRLNLTESRWSIEWPPNVEVQESKQRYYNVATDLCGRVDGGSAAG